MTPRVVFTHQVGNGRSTGASANALQTASPPEPRNPAPEGGGLPTYAVVADQVSAVPDAASQGTVLPVPSTPASSASAGGGSRPVLAGTSIPAATALRMSPARLTWGSSPSTPHSARAGPRKITGVGFGRSRHAEALQRPVAGSSTRFLGGLEIALQLPLRSTGRHLSHEVGLAVVDIAAGADPTQPALARAPNPVLSTART